MIKANELRIFGFVYKITNLINGKVYIGITRKNINKRWNEHKHNSIRKKKKAFINNAILKYGHINFKIEKIKTCYSNTQLYSAEQYFISKYKSNDRIYGYNNSIGGECSSLGKKLSYETKIKISKYQIQRKRMPHSIETISNMSNSAKGRNMRALWEKSANNRRGKPAHNSISIIQYDLNGNFINKYKSLTEAAQKVNGVVSAFIAIKKGRLKTYKSYKWKLEN